MAFSASACLCCTVFLFGPLELYIREYSPALLDLVNFILPLLLILLCVVLLLSWALTKLLPSSLFEVLSALIIAVGLICYLQADIVPFPYGPLNGTEVKWENFRLYTIGDSCLWIIGIVFAIWFRKKLVVISAKLVTIFIAYQLILSVCIWSLSPGSKPAQFRLTNDTEYRFSSTKNIMIFVLDAFESDVFHEITGESVYYKKIFENFTYFPDTIGGFGTTKASVPLILTGQFYDNSIPFQRFVDTAFKDGSIPSELTAAKYIVEAFGMGIPVNVPVFSNIAANKCIGFPSFLIMNHLCAYLVKCTPSLLKGMVLEYYYDNYFEYSARSDIRFINNFEKLANVGTDAPVFKYFHLRGVHPPFVMNEKMSVEHIEQNYAGYKQQAKGAIRIAERFLNTLRKIGAYENAMIFVIGDHGWWAPSYEQAYPLFLWKPFKSKSDFSTSEIPVSLIDIKKTIFDALGVKAKSEGFSLFHLGSFPRDRQRRYMDYTWEHRYWGSEYMPDMRGYVISGPALNPCSWKRSFINYMPHKTELKRIDPVHPPTSLWFKKGGNFFNYVGLGWSLPEGDFVWNSGRWASIYLPISDNKSSLKIILDVFPFLCPGRVNAQRVKVFANCIPVAELVVDKPGEYGFVVPSTCLDQALLSLTFEFPDSISPSELKLSRDSRRLGLTFKKMRIQVATDDAG
jgi:hypothetical protein